MPILFIGTGTVFLLTGLMGDPGKLYDLVRGDFTGQNNYVFWVISILVLGSLGYIESLKNLSRLFVALILIVLLLDNKGFFAKLQEFINSTQGTPVTAGAGGSY